MKKISLLLVLSLLLSTLGAVALAEVDPSTLEPYEIVWYTLGTPSDDDDKVLEKINEYLTEHFNATLKMYLNDTTTHREKLNLMISAQQEFDIAFVDQDYPSFVANEAFYPLDDLLQEYGQSYLEKWPDSLWDSVTMSDGHIYAIPSHKYSCTHYYYMINKGAADAAGVDLSWIESDLTKMEKWEKFKETLLAMKEGGADYNGYVTDLDVGPFQALYPYDALTGKDSMPAVTIIGEDSFADQEPNVVFNPYTTPEFEAYVRDAYMLAQAGVTPLDPETKIELARNDPVVKVQDSMGKRIPGYEVQWGIELDVYFLNYAFTNTNKIYGSMQAISDTSGDPERAMMFLNAINSDVDFANLVFYGIEGLNWNRNDDGQIEMTNPKTYTQTTWALPGFLTAEPDISLPLDIAERYAAFADELIYSDNVGFTFDPTNVMIENAAVTNVIAEYLKPLAMGLSDPDVYLPQFLDALESAGVQSLIDEVQAQLDAWRTAQGKS